MSTVSALPLFVNEATSAGCVLLTMTYGTSHGLLLPDWRLMAIVGSGQVLIVA